MKEETVKISFEDNFYVFEIPKNNFIDICKYIDKKRDKLHLNIFDFSFNLEEEKYNIGWRVYDLKFNKDIINFPFYLKDLTLNFIKQKLKIKFMTNLIKD